MYKKLIIIAALTSCAYKHDIKVSQQNIEKPSLEFYRENLQKPEIITHDKCYLINSPKTPVVCMYHSEYDKETQNYRIMLDIVKQYQLNKKYNDSIK